MMVPDKQALHLADFVFERMQPCASHRFPVFDRQQQAAKGFRIPTRESGQLVIEMLERQIDSQFVRVLLKERAGLLEILGSFRLNQFHHDNHLSLKPAVKRAAANSARPCSDDRLPTSGKQWIIMPV